MYTAAIWQATHVDILRCRALLTVKIIMLAFVIRCGAALSSQERFLVGRQYDLKSRLDEAGNEVFLLGV